MDTQNYIEYVQKRYPDTVLAGYLNVPEQRVCPATVDLVRDLCGVGYWLEQVEPNIVLFGIESSFLDTAAAMAQDMPDDTWILFYVGDE